MQEKMSNAGKKGEREQSLSKSGDKNVSRRRLFIELLSAASSE
jgi:hypothetical protein